MSVVRIFPMSSNLWNFHIIQRHERGGDLLKPLTLYRWPAFKVWHQQIARCAKSRLIDIFLSISPKICNFLSNTNQNYIGTYVLYIFQNSGGFLAIVSTYSCGKKGHNVWKWSKMYHMNFQWFHNKITFLQMFEFLRQNCTCKSCELGLFELFSNTVKESNFPYCRSFLCLWCVCVAAKLSSLFFQEENCIKRLGFLLLQETRTKLSSPAVRRKVLWQYSLGIFPSVTLFVYD